jgi:hypothetical protein
MPATPALVKFRKRPFQDHAVIYLQNTGDEVLETGSIILKYLLSDGSVSDETLLNLTRLEPGEMTRLYLTLPSDARRIFVQGYQATRSTYPMTGTLRRRFGFWGLDEHVEAAHMAGSGRRMSSGIRMGIAAAAVLTLGVSAWMFTVSSTSAREERRLAAGPRTICEDSIRPMLTVPDAARFADSTEAEVVAADSGKYVVVSFVEGVSSEGFVMRTQFACTLTRLGGGRWRVDSLEVATP